MEENSKKLTNLDQIGEFGLIDLITKDFEIINDTYSQGETMQLRLETDQLRDWHKPTAEWSLVTS